MARVRHICWWCDFFFEDKHSPKDWKDDVYWSRPLINKGDDHITIERRKENGSIKLTPGISGYAQINGRINISPEEKADLDGYYFEHIFFLLDTKIFIITILQT